MLRRLRAHPSWKPIAVPVLRLTLLVICGLADELYRLVASVFIPQYHYPYVVGLCFAQVLVSLLLLTLLPVLRLAPQSRYSRALGERLLVPSVCDSAQAVLAMWARANGAADGGLFPHVVRLQPLVTAVWSHGLGLDARPSARLAGLVAGLSGVSLVITGSQGASSGPRPLEYLYAPLSLILQGITLTWLAKVSEAERHRRRRRHRHSQQASSIDLYYAHLVNQSGVLGLLWLLHPDGPWRALSEGSWCCLLFHGYLLAILLLGAALHCAVGLTALRCTPLAAALLSAAGGWAGPLLSFFHS